MGFWKRCHGTGPFVRRGYNHSSEGLLFSFFLLLLLLFFGLETYSRRLASKTQRLTKRGMTILANKQRTISRPAHQLGSREEKIGRDAGYKENCGRYGGSADPYWSPSSQGLFTWARLTEISTSHYFLRCTTHVKKRATPVDRDTGGGLTRCSYEHFSPIDREENLSTTHDCTVA